MEVTILHGLTGYGYADEVGSTITINDKELAKLLISKGLVKLGTKKEDPKPTK
jgi:hypothetical protein